MRVSVHATCQGAIQFHTAERRHDEVVLFTKVCSVVGRRASHHTHHYIKFDISFAIWIVGVKTKNRNTKTLRNHFVVVRAARAAWCVNKTKSHATHSYGNACSRTPAPRTCIDLKLETTIGSAFGTPPTPMA